MVNTFLIAPFSKEFTNVRDIIKNTVKNMEGPLTFNCICLEDLKTPGRITDDLLRNIHEAHIIISDVTDCNPNVMWETGYAMALHKPIIQLTQSIKKLPFDLKDIRTIKYDNDVLKDLAKKLESSLEATLKEITIDVKGPVTPEPVKPILGISVTGSMILDVDKSKVRFENIIEPYIGKNVKWYVGSFGDVDEMIVTYLSKMKEQVITVGYHAHDYTKVMVDLINTNKIPFIDSQRERLPDYPGSPSKRDVYMASRSDMAIMLWNGKSPGTKQLIDWYKEIKKDHIVCFV